MQELNSKDYIRHLKINITIVTGNDDEMYSINYSGLIPLLLEAVKDLQEKVTKLASCQNRDEKSDMTFNT